MGAESSNSYFLTRITQVRRCARKGFNEDPADKAKRTLRGSPTSDLR